MTITEQQVAALEAANQRRQEELDTKQSLRDRAINARKKKADLDQSLQRLDQFLLEDL